MKLDQLYPYGFRSTLFDRLIPESEHIKGWSVQELRESVAQDLEDLLNSRMAKLDHIIDDFPLVKKSIAQFGIIDFVGLSTANLQIVTKFVVQLSSQYLHMSQDCDRLKSKC